MTTTPWSGGPRPDGLWISPDDQSRADRFNGRLPPDDGRRIHYTTASGKPLFPAQWCGDPWTAPIILLLLNPALSIHSGDVQEDEEMRRRLTHQATGQWDPEYPLVWLSPRGRQVDDWCASIPFRDLQRHLVNGGMDPEDAWRRVAQRCALLELGPWASAKWSSGAICSTTPLSVQLASAAMADPNRIVLLGRGEDDWRTAGLIDVDLLPKSLGVRVNQSRINERNFPGAWQRIVQLLTA